VQEYELLREEIEGLKKKRILKICWIVLMNKAQIVFLARGRGSRLWPLS
jgi:hypothetical protein